MDATAFQSRAFQHASRVIAAVAVMASRRGSTTASGSGAGVGVGPRNEEVSPAGVGEGVAGGGAWQVIAPPGVAFALAANGIGPGDVERADSPGASSREERAPRPVVPRDDTICAGCPPITTVSDPSPIA